MKASKILFIVGIILAIIGVVMMWNLNPIGFKISAIAVCFVGLSLIVLHYEKFKTNYYE